MISRFVRCVIPVAFVSLAASASTIVLFSTRSDRSPLYFSFLSRVDTSIAVKRRTRREERRSLPYKDECRIAQSDPAGGREPLPQQFCPGITTCPLRRLLPVLHGLITVHNLSKPISMVAFLAALVAVVLALMPRARALTPLEMLSTNQYAPAVPNPTGVC